MEPFTIYSYRIESYNDQGNTSSRIALVTITFPSRPCCNFTFRLFNIRSSTVEILWTQPQKLNGLNLLYFIKIYQKLDLTKANSLNNIREQENSSVTLEHTKLTSENGLFRQTIQNLFAYKSYLITIRACNRDLTDLTKLYCIEGTPSTPTDFSNFIFFITSQDRPELQPAPSLISLNSSYVILGVRRPLRPNGIILLYEIWIQSLDTSSSNKELACAIEDLYDPNDPSTINSDNKQKICFIRNLNSNTPYAFSVTSSTIIGRSLPSSDLFLTTQEDQPICPPQLQTANSFQSDEIYFNWLPSLNMSIYDTYWKNCLGGALRNFSIYKINSNTSQQIVYTGLENNFNLTRLNSSSLYSFRIELCNQVGCLSTSVIQVTTSDPPPAPWLQQDLKYELINSTRINFDWSGYNPFKSGNQNQNLKFRLERAKISFAYPPTPLEQGIRFHGFNYFKFSPDKYFPQGYPYFGLKYSFKTSKDSSLIYFAASSYAQSELTLSQLQNNQPWFISNTQASSNDACSIYLYNKQETMRKQEWNSFRVFRLNNYAYLRFENKTAEINSSICSNQVITDVTGVYIGGVPDNFLSRDESSLNIQRNKFTGCIKNISALVQFDSVKFPPSSMVDFNFSDAEQAPGESLNSNTIYGCPINLDTQSRPVHLLGFGYLFANLKQTMPISLQTNKLITVEFDFRTEWSNGFLYFNYDLDNEQFVIVRILNSTQIEVDLKTRVRYDTPGSSVGTYSNFFDILVNETFNTGQFVINNGYWCNMNISIDFISRSILLSLNKTLIGSRSIFTNKSLPFGLDRKILEQPLLFTFYLNVKFYFGGYDISMLSDIFDTLSQAYVTVFTKQYFLPLFRLVASLDDDLYFTGCLRNIRINSFLIDFADLNNLVQYKNVRFDGCPRLEYLNWRERVSLQENESNIEVISENLNYTSMDTNFLPFTEYFYRVVAYNSQVEKLIFQF